MNVTTENIIQNYKKAYPSDTFLVYKYSAPGGYGWCYGVLLLQVQLNDHDWLEVYKLSSTSAPVINSDRLKAKAFPFIYDTKNQTDVKQRRISLRDSLKNIFPEHDVNVFIFPSDWSYSVTNCKGSVSFIKEYGYDVHIVLN